MRVLCSKCKLECKIQMYRERLNEIIIKKNYNLLDDEVVGVSQFLDELISNCIIYDANHVYNLNKKNSNELYKVLHYYGNEQLFLNLYYYISEGIRNNELIYISMKKSNYNELLEKLKINRIFIDNVKFKRLKHKSIKEDNLKKEIDEVLSSIENDYEGIRLVIDTTNNSKNDFTSYSKELKTFLSERRIKILEVCDIYEYTNDCNYINNKLINI